MGDAIKRSQLVLEPAKKGRYAVLGTIGTAIAVRFLRSGQQGLSRPYPLRASRLATHRCIWYPGTAMGQMAKARFFLLLSFAPSS